MDDAPWKPSDRRTTEALGVRVTRLEERLVALASAMERQIRVDTEVHRDTLMLLSKMDERIDKEHDERMALTADLRALATKVAIVGGLALMVAQIAGPVIVKLFVP